MNTNNLVVAENVNAKLIELKRRSRINKISAVCIYFLCLLIMVGSIIIKFSVVEKFSAEKIWVFYIILGVILAGLCIVHVVYLLGSRRNLLTKTKTLAALLAALTFSFVINLFLESFSVYLMPVSIAAFIIAPLCQRRDAFTANIFVNIFLFFTLIAQSILSRDANIYPIVMMFITGIFTGSLASYWVSNDTKRLNYILKSFVIVVLSIILLFATRFMLLNQLFDYFDVLKFLLIGMFGQVILAQLLQPVLEAVFNLITNMRLVEFTDHNSPLIKKLIVEAPGTFNHCLAVANFAEMCASAIGENPYLARACAYYHDIGKLYNAQYFKENQSDYNPHDELLPEVSADIIRAHTVEGYKLCQSYRIPQEIADITVQHHGTLPIYVFYSKAKKLTDSEISIYDYSYHGIKPVSKIAAIIMICDSAEAMLRALVNPTVEQIDKFIKQLINDRINAAQFDDCDISLSELELIRQTINMAYGGQFHKRLLYPDEKK